MRADVRLGLPLAVAIAVAITGCSVPVPGPTPGVSMAPGGTSPTGAVVTSAPAADRPFTLLTAERPSTLDPALASSDADAMVALDVFQRVLAAPPGGGALEPDAGDCLFREPTLYECTLSAGLTFTNTHALTSSDVKFSIERMLKLAPQGPTGPLFSSLASIETPDALTIRFRLNAEDTEFGYALASPAASIVDEETYEPDKVRPDTAKPFGSGPYALSASSSVLRFTQNDAYDGAAEVGLSQVLVRFADDSVAAEEALSAGSVDAVWRALDEAALARIAAGVTSTSARPTVLAAARPVRLVWDADSPARARVEVRAAVAAALQDDRTTSSLVPSRIAGSVGSFAAGGRPAKARLGKAVSLVLGYASASPEAADLAVLSRARLEASGMDVTITADAKRADLRIDDQSAQVDTAVSWLEPYLAHPLPGSASKLAALSVAARAGGDEGGRLAAVAEIQRQAAVDATVLPMSPGDQTVFVGPGYQLRADGLGPSGQLGLWGFDD